jgi:hypothetical protein
MNIRINFGRHSFLNNFFIIWVSKFGILHSKFDPSVISDDLFQEIYINLLSYFAIKSSLLARIQIVS